MEAMEKLKSGQRFSEVAAQYSEDKARQGVSECCTWNRAAGPGSGCGSLRPARHQQDPSHSHITHPPLF